VDSAGGVSVLRDLIYRAAMTDRALGWRRLLLALLVGSIPLLGAGPARANEDLNLRTDVGLRDFRFELGLVGGYQYFDDEHTLSRADNDPPGYSPYHAGVFGLQFTFNLARYVALEAEGLATRTYTIDRNTNLYIFQFGGHIVFHPATGVVRPYLLLGYGAMASVIRGESPLEDDQDGVGRAALGLKIALGSRVNLRLEGRVQSSLAFASKWVSWGDETAYGGPDFVGIGGLSINLGEQRAKVVVAEKVVYTPPPTEDPDKDGLPTRADRCPDVAEDPDGFHDEDGCPENDNDGDGIADADDRCPLRPEDKNGIDDADGCPDKDDDNDGIFGSRDQCPQQPETKNGIADFDGCPDEVPQEVKRFTGVIEGINFKLRSANLLPNSLPVLDRAIAVLKSYPDIKIEISGHTDNRGKADANRDLSQRRAEAVRNYLVSRGISPDRLVAIGYGMDRPISDNRTESGRGKNRRTEFRILSAE
jgi:OmpA-OmpF porin, OOP family